MAFIFKIILRLCISFYCILIIYLKCYLSCDLLKKWIIFDIPISPYEIEERVYSEKSRSKEDYNLFFNKKRTILILLVSIAKNNGVKFLS